MKKPKPPSIKDDIRHINETKARLSSFNSNLEDIQERRELSMERLACYDRKKQCRIDLAAAQPDTWRHRRLKAYLKVMETDWLYYYLWLWLKVKSWRLWREFKYNCLLAMWVPMYLLLTAALILAFWFLVISLLTL